MPAQSYIHRDYCHGWMGVRFQPCPGDVPSEIIIHVRMLDHENLQQQEALGIMGVNLIYGAINLHHNPDGFIKSLMDDLTPDRVEVDMIKFSGPAFQMMDNRPASLQLVQQGLTNAAMFTANGEALQDSEVLYKKSILVERGSFRPVTKVTLDMLNCCQAQFVQEPGVQGEEVVVLMEMTLKNLIDEGAIDYLDFLERVDILGKPVLISNYGEYHRLPPTCSGKPRKKSASRWACRACAKFSTRNITPTWRAASSNRSDASSKTISSSMSIRSRTPPLVQSSRPATCGSRPTCAISTPTSMRTISSRACAITAPSSCPSSPGKP